MRYMIDLDIYLDAADSLRAAEITAQIAHTVETLGGDVTIMDICDDKGVHYDEDGEAWGKV